LIKIDWRLYLLYNFIAMLSKISRGIQKGANMNKVS